jgi:uncharacterized membrane protein YgcG
MRTIARAIRRLTWATMIVVLMLLLASPAIGATEYGEPVPGQRVYDTTGLLTADELAELEARAAAVEAAGAPVIVYLQARDASQRETEADARALMDAWDVQSAPGARDGVVLFFNLQPDNLRRGEVFIYAGEKHFDGGNLPQSELQRIIDEEMIPLLRADQTAAGIGAGLDAIAHALTYGPPPPPPPSRFERIAEDLTAGVFSIVNLVSSAIAALVFAIGLRRFRERPVAHGTATPTTMPPSTRPPAVAGALVDGHIMDRHLEATLIDLANRGALAIEPAGEKKVQVRLLDRTLLRTPFEVALWEALEESSAGAGLVTSKELRASRSKWSRAREELRKHLEHEGLYAPNPGSRRRPAYLAAAVGFLVTVIAAVLAGGAEQPLAGIGPSLLGIASLVTLILAASIRDTTQFGEAEAVAWRGYKEGITSARNDLAAVLDLDEVLPYAVAFGVVDSLDDRLKEASDAGYQPAWFNATMQPGSSMGFYPYWVGFHTAVSPPSSSSGGSVGGASAGGGGAGGSF